MNIQLDEAGERCGALFTRKCLCKSPILSQRTLLVMRLFTYQDRESWCQGRSPSQIEILQFLDLHLSSEWISDPRPHLLKKPQILIDSKSFLQRWHGASSQADPAYDKFR